MEVKADRDAITVSNPSIVHPKSSQASITASEDYYSLSGSTESDDTTIRRSASTRTAIPVSWEEAQRATQSLERPRTPSDQYRTPLQSTTQLAQQQSNRSLEAAVVSHNANEGETGDIEEEGRKTPMRGEGKRRSLQGYPSDTEGGVVAAGTAGAVAGGSTILRTSGIRRKPVPSTVMEPSGGSPESQDFIDQAGARSSVAKDLDREEGGTSPAVDDTPYIRFALDQLTRDEEVRGSRRYPDGGTGDAFVNERRGSPVSPISERSNDGLDARTYDNTPRYGDAGAAAAVVGTAAALHERHASQEEPQQPASTYSTPWRPDHQRPYHQRQQSSQNMVVCRQEEQPNIFVPITNEHGYHQSLDFLPILLRPVSLLLFIFFLVILLVLLLVGAIWSLTHARIFDYGNFGDGKYFLLRYFPLILGMALFYWLVQIQVAVYRITPFIAMASDLSSRAREEGVLLPLSPKTFLTPYLGHFRAQQPIVGVFMTAAWLQIFTIPLLASSFNVHQGSGFNWVATAAAIWTVIALYLILLVSTLALFFWLLRQRGQPSGTGVRWDPTSFADLVVLLERSNALYLSDQEELRHEAPKLGYWRTSRGANEVFHSYGVENKPARRYSLKDGRIREKIAPATEPKSRFSDFDDYREMGREQRHSREKMLPKRLHPIDEHGDVSTGGRAVPWFIKPIFAIIWIVLTLVLILALLIASYLPSIRISNGFAPMVPAIVGNLGFSGTNFLYSFLPGLVGMICFLGILDIDYAYRRLQTFTSLIRPTNDGETAERSLLISYTADLPVIVTLRAFADRNMRVAALSLASFLATTLPILSGGVFWAQFDTASQSVKVYPEMPGYYALTVFLALYALAIIVCVYPSKATRSLDRELPLGDGLMSFRDYLDVVRMSRMLDDVAFHAVASKLELVTRLLSATPSAPGYRQSPTRERTDEKIGMSDRLRGFGPARLQARRTTGAVPRYQLGKHVGRDGKEYIGVDWLRR